MLIRYLGPIYRIHLKLVADVKTAFAGSNQRPQATRHRLIDDPFCWGVDEFRGLFMGGYAPSKYGTAPPKRRGVVESTDSRLWALIAQLWQFGCYVLGPLPKWSRTQILNL